jgi:hypothetical protein
VDLRSENLVDRATPPALLLSTASRRARHTGHTRRSKTPGIYCSLLGRRRDCRSETLCCLEDVETEHELADLLLEPL